MKIAHLIYTNGIAGAEKYLLHLLPALRHHGYECELIIIWAPGSGKIMEGFCESFRQQSVTVTSFEATRRSFLRTAWKISRHLKQIKCNVVHSHLLNSDVIVSLIKQLFIRNLVFISTKHGYKESILKLLGNNLPASEIRALAKRELYYYVMRFTIASATHSYAVSQAIARLYFDLGLMSSLMPHVYHGLTITGAGDDNAPSAYRSAETQLVVVGRLEQVKGHSSLFKAMPAVLDKFPLCKLVLIGDGAEKQYLLELAKKLGISENIEFMGFNNNPYPYISNSDLALVPSYFEAFGLVYLEAFALKTPLIAFDTPAGNEFLENEVNALLVPVKDSEALAEKIIFLLQNPARARELADAAYKKYIAYFSTEKMVENTAAYYRKVLS